MSTKKSSSVLQEFVSVEVASGLALAASAVVALVVANSAWGPGYEAFWKSPVGPHSLRHWINDGLMAVFFLLIGLEVKREWVVGELRDRRAAVLPLAAAIGGMVVPASVYLLLQAGEPGARGWGIPMATDIAFVVGCLALLGPRVPHALRVFVLSLAIIDDIGAILVIALGYSSGVAIVPLALGAAGVTTMAVLLRRGVRQPAILGLVALGTWAAIHESGIHATLAGVALGLLAPATPDNGQQTSPLEQLEHAIHPAVAFGVMPIFALANAGVVVDGSSLGHPVAVAVALGLLVGKPVGIVGSAWMAVRLGWAVLPAAVSWTMVTGAAFLAGIGFTMALFITSLALDGPLQAAAKVGVLAGSAIAAAIGVAVLVRHHGATTERP